MRCMENRGGSRFTCLGEGRYEADCTLAAAHGCVAPKGCAILLRLSAQGTHPCVPVKPTRFHPWNRTTIPRRVRAVASIHWIDWSALTLPCTTTSAPFTVFN